MSLFASRRVIDLRMPTGKPGKEGSDAIVEYCENPPPDTVLLIVCNEWSKQQQSAAWVEAIERVGMVVPVWTMKPEELPAWIGQRMASRGLKPDHAAIEALAERVEGNSLAAAQEIDKLALLHGSQPLDADTLEALVADSARFDVFKLVDAALEGDGARTIRILHGLRAEGEMVPAIMGWVLNQLQMLARIAANSNQAAAFRNERIWPARERVYKQALSRADRTHWENCLVQAARVDRLSKGRGYGDAWIALERLMAAVAMPRAKLLAAV
jgi:DNA polymerase-3 subunit delta